jgi:hypothetical protein
MKERRKETLSSDHKEMTMRWRGDDEEGVVEGVQTKSRWLKRGVSR